ncbi:hypothetical protein [Glaciecola sp. KUL10]|jgi:hypothetical protein|uniref:hypothetical protein n=1 Tax=Glaciecola sp. (strain KUL10) TaxID=2161813 RepID=UPI000D78C113|nr:hypothetical protein [Glaciecola sp. KUL10]GBL06003.1 hypothetical protein KUL10_33370 [Glaciecola sp. KUL10]
MSVLKASTKKALFTSIFVSTFALSGAASANENGVANVLSSMMQNAITQTAQEIDIQLQKSIIELGHSIEIAPADLNLPATTVTITDLARIEKTEDLNFSEEAND